MLPIIKELVITVKIPLIGEEIPITQCSFLVERNLIRSCHNSKKMDAKCYFFMLCQKNSFCV